jgi:hypothetical protein
LFAVRRGGGPALPPTLGEVPKAASCVLVRRVERDIRHMWPGGRRGLRCHRGRLLQVGSGHFCKRVSSPSALVFVASPESVLVADVAGEERAVPDEVRGM